MSTAQIASARRRCALVPAAGRGTRLGLADGTPKVFIELSPGVTVWDALRGLLAPWVEKIVLVLSPEGQSYYEAHAARQTGPRLEPIEVVVQLEPRGMGDAIFGAVEAWREYNDLLVVWGDQFNLSPETLRGVVAQHGLSGEPRVTLPLVRPAQAYVAYEFAATGDRLEAIRQAREGDFCPPHALADAGLFLLTGGPALAAEWGRYGATALPGATTGEINFLPFLVHLSAAGWPVCGWEIKDPAEALGINTPEQLRLARELVQSRGRAR